ncbi:MAG: hypothetical protein OEY22_10270 [Candidatus Bathyarchaeota archaeon]|nr:hypothetical protein [Candidatus Bathyarchaeota archaeon]MDH5788554.1 hypothetical protein [Candidatus Bathyarchaeota archaeon]
MVKDQDGTIIQILVGISRNSWWTNCAKDKKVRISIIVSPSY